MKKFKSYLAVGLRLFGKYVLPIVLGYLEGDTHTLQDALGSLF